MGGGRQIVFGAGVAALALIGFLGVRSALPTDSATPAASETPVAPDDSIEELFPPPLASDLGSLNDAAAIVEMSFDVDGGTAHARGRGPHGPRHKKAPPRQ